MTDKFLIDRNANPMQFGSKIMEWYPDDIDLPAGTRGVHFDADGTVDLTNQDGTTVSGYPVVANTLLPIIPARITAMFGPSTCYLVI